MMSVWETVLLSAVVLLVVLWVGRGLGPAFEHSRRAEKHWRDVLIPVAWVVVFVVFLILIT